jgi:23S rRNA pseudouridine1911/1915/1917 synthase
MEIVEFSWIHDEPSLKEALKNTLGCSGQLIKRYFSSKEQDRKIFSKQTIKLPLTLVNHLKINPQYQGPEIAIISESENFIVLHKPAGLHCHPLAYEDKDTLLNFLVTAGKWEALLINEAHYDRGLLYRLDYETSGVMVLAKNEKALRVVRENFNLTMKRKFYWAIVEGDFDQDGPWSHHFKPTGLKGIKQKVSDHSDVTTTEASLAVMKIAFQQDKSLVLVNLKTGLRHQIRAQLAHLGFPILGDILYGGRAAERVFLHALRYEFFETVEDPAADLFEIFFDLNSALKMSHDMLGRF